jgi:5-(carboxyamino)imidazole ribonucleotide synthase
MKDYHFAGKDFILGILGGGQLGRMLIQEAINLNISTAVLDPDPDAPCRFLTETFVCGDFRDEEQVYNFGRTVDVLTVEIEHVNVQALKRLQNEGVKVFPEPRILEIVQDKGLQKEFFTSNKIATAPYFLVDNKEQLNSYKERFPMMMKLRKGGYDGKGVIKIQDESRMDAAFDAPSIVEELIDFSTEVSVIGARNSNGEIKLFPAVDMEFNPEANLVEFLCSPARLDVEITDKALALAEEVISKLQITGILAIEMFVTKQGDVLVNEIAPRPHNSGHQTIEGNITSQFAQHLRAILGLPLGDTSIIKPSVMINLLGEKGYEGEALYHGIGDVMDMSGVYIHLYGKKVTKPMRKMGHVTVTDSRQTDAIEKAKIVQQKIKVISEV